MYSIGTELPARLLCDEVMPEEPSSSSNHERAPDNSTILLSSSDEGTYNIVLCVLKQTSVDS